MSETNGTKSWFTSLPGVLTTLAAIVTATGGLIAALPPAWRGQSAPEPVKKHACMAGYVPRRAVADDLVCVTLETHQQTLQDNMLAGSRRNPGGGDYGADSCVYGYVWREAFKNDHVCVTSDTRAQAYEDNQQAAARLAQ
jgi:hypothetical protein